MWDLESMRNLITAENCFEVGQWTHYLHIECISESQSRVCHSRKNTGWESGFVSPSLALLLTS